MKNSKKMPLVAMLLLIGIVPLLGSVMTTLLISVEQFRDIITDETVKRLKTISYDTSNYYGVDWNSWMETGFCDGDYKYIDQHMDEGIVLTVFKEDTRYLSSIRDANGERISGTKANDDVISQVYKNGGDYTADNVEISGKKYFVYYTPIRNEDDEIVGMSFAGETMESIESSIASVRGRIVLISFICIAFYTVLTILLSFKLKRPFDFLDKALEKLAGGNLDTSFKTNTFLRETTQMLKSSGELRDQLREIVGDIKSETLTLNDNASRLISIAGSTNQNIENCSTAVSEIAQGTIASAEDTEAISTQCEELERISNSLSAAMDDMKESADEALEISSNAKDTMVSLENISGETQTIVDNISGQMQAVNNRLTDVGTIVTAIADITSQTNLLSLNASIEAARAGEAGRGFAVVANEIRNLAESSAENANQINDIINGLVSEIKKTTEFTEQLVTQSADQVRQLNATGEQLDKCIEEINLISSNVDHVNGQTQGLNDATHAVGVAVTNLSAVTAQNSASAQETTASMNESSEQVALLNDNAKDVAGISDKLKKLMAYFKDSQ